MASSIANHTITIRKQLILMVIMSAATIALALIVSLAIFEFITFKRESRSYIESLANVTAKSISPALAINDPVAIKKTLDGFSADPNILWILVLDADGKPIGNYNRGQKQIDAEDLISTVQRRKRGTESMNSLSFDITTNIERPVLNNNIRVGTIFIELDDTVMIKHFSEFIWMALAVLGISALVVIAFARRLITIVSEPIEQMTAVIRQVSASKNFSLRSTVNTDNELGDLSKGLNEMLREVELRDARQCEKQQHLDRLANYDALTGLANRLLFEDRLKQALEHGRRREEFFALLFIDLDDFKCVNDTYGHKTGDLLLCEAARRLENSVRSEDTVARMGGDEFTGILVNIQNIKNAVSLARKLLNNLVSIYTIEGIDIFVGASIGVAVFPSHGVAMHELIRRADLAMYHAKELGKNNVVVFSNVLLEKTENRDLLREELQLALDSEQLELFYQPRIDLVQGQYIGAEVLLRWNHPVRGLITPKILIPIAEETGLIIPIGNWVIRRCCQELKMMHQSGFFVPRVSINLSPAQMHQDDLADVFRTNIVDFGICSNILEIEIAETVLFNADTQVHQNLTSLQALNIRVSIDDFGSELIPLDRLSELKIHSLKLSSELLQKCDDDEIAEVIRGATGRAEMELHFKGVETSDQELKVRTMGGSMAQGFLYSRPLPLASFTAFLKTRDPMKKQYTHCPNCPDSTVCSRLVGVGDESLLVDHLPPGQSVNHCRGA